MRPRLSALDLWQRHEERVLKILGLALEKLRCKQALPEAEDPINRLSSRPDFMILAYPVISFTSKYAHAASKDNLLGDQSGNARRLESLSNEKQVTTGTPPTFIVHTGDNKEVLPENSVLFYVSYRRCGVPIEMHIYEKGGHAFGLAPDDPVLSSWTRRCADWMRRRGLLTKAGQ